MDVTVAQRVVTQILGPAATRALRASSPRSAGKKHAKSAELELTKMPMLRLIASPAHLANTSKPKPVHLVIVVGRGTTNQSKDEQSVCSAAVAKL